MPALSLRFGASSQLPRLSGRFLVPTGTERKGPLLDPDLSSGPRAYLAGPPGLRAALQLGKAGSAVSRRSFVGR